MRLTVIISMIVMMLIMTGCNSQTASGFASKQQKETVDLTPQEIFQNNCSGCHGGNLQGNIGPSLQKIGSKYSREEIKNIIQSGKGQMPAQSQMPDEVRQKLATWLSQKK